jgi:hypothetical protein
VTGRYRVIIVAEQSTAVREFCIGRGMIRLALAAAALALLGPLAVGVSVDNAGGAQGPRLAAVRPKASVGPSASSGADRGRWLLGRGVANGGLRLLGRVKLQAEPRSEACGPGMVLVEGAYCPVIHQRCLRFVDPPGSSLYSQRCAEFESRARCLSPQREQLRYCIDVDEYVEQTGRLPKTRLRAVDARSACESAGKRLCTEKEWTFACEGETISPYPYGFARDSTRCNSDQSDLVAPDGTLVDRRAQPGTHPQCQSAFGVRDLTGNVEEYAALDSDPARFVRKGAYWQPGANTCRTVQAHPEPGYQGIELGFRCCSDAPGAASGGAT